MNIENELLPGEELLYKCKANPKKNKIGILVLILFDAFFLILLTVLSFMVKLILFKIFAGIIGGLLIFFTVPVILMEIKQSSVIRSSKNNEYFITNRRIIIYGPKTETMIYSVDSLKSVIYQLVDKGRYGIFQLCYNMNLANEQEGPQNIIEGIDYTLNLYRLSANDDYSCFLIGIEEPDKLISIIKSINPNVSFAQAMTIKKENNEKNI